MGWLFAYDPNFKRADQVRELNSPRTYSEGWTLLKHRLVGNHLWHLVQRPNGQRTIGLFLLKGGGRTMGWGYKDMCEDSYPYYYDCPLSLLDACTPPTSDNARKWRELVRVWHARRRNKPKAVPGLKVHYGDKTYTLVEPVGRRLGWWVKDEHGFNYRMNSRQLSRALFNEVKS